MKRWNTDQPDNAGGNENCLTLDLRYPGEALLDDVPCSSKFQYICEVLKIAIIFKR
jgi:hypothetical protein